MSQPTAAEALAALDATWPARRIIDQHGWRLREGSGGGKRVSAASPLCPEPDLASALDWMGAQGVGPLFRLVPEDAALDAALAARGFRLIDPTLIYAAPVASMAAPLPPVRLFDLWPPLSIMRRIWAEGGIGPARQAVMDRAPAPRTALLARIEDRVAGVAFIAQHKAIAMLHAMEVMPQMRRKGGGETLLRGAANWAQAQGARHLALAVTEANTTARQLYQRLGLQVVARYHYRDAPQEAP